MMDIPLYQEAMYHALGGIALAIADRQLSQNAARNRESRLAERLDHIEALTLLRDTEQAPDRADRVNSSEYFAAIVKARDYFRENGHRAHVFPRGLRNLPARARESLDYWLTNERLNSLGAGKRLGVAYGIEIAVDATVGVSQIAWGIGNGIAAMGESMYQGAALWVGLTIGKAGLGVYDMFARPHEEKEAIRLAKRLTEDGKLLKVVQSYDPATFMESTKPALIEQDGTPALPAPAAYTKRVRAAIADASNRALTAVSSTVTDLKEGINARAAAKEQERQARREKLRSRYDGY